MVSCAKLTLPAALRQPLERLYRDFDYGARLGRDAIQYPLRYADPADREIVALLTACLAYGRVDLFGRALEGALAVMGPSPATFVREFDPARVARAPADPRGYPRREHEPGHRPHASAHAELADGRGDHSAAGRARSRRSRQVRLRALPHAHGRRLSGPPGRRHLPSVRPARRLPSLEAGRSPPEASMTEIAGV